MENKFKLPVMESSLDEINSYLFIFQPFHMSKSLIIELFVASETVFVINVLKTHSTPENVSILCTNFKNKLSATFQAFLKLQPCCFCYSSLYAFHQPY